MTEYEKECVRDYINALVRAERMMRDSEHDLWTADEVNDLYNISRDLRKALNKVTEGMSQKLYKQHQEL